ncbi:MAG TPA: HAD family hydrolase [Anaerohalosphaeraceae bacterium]|nr:HAD family hydrolase [Anaerohalosphaeraceae bacterium]
MAGRAVEAILFDLGQTLLEFSKLRTNRLFAVSVRASYAWLKQHSQPVPFFLRYRLKHLFGLYLHLIYSTLTGNDFDSLELLKGYGKRYGFTLSDQQYKELNWIWYEPLSKVAFTEPNLKETLIALRAMGLKLGIVSNTFVNKDSLQRHLAQVGILGFFPVQLYTCDFPYRKPDPRIFLDAARQIDVEPARILFVGDRIDTDIKGSIAAGMRPVFKRIHANWHKTVPAGVIEIQKIADLPEVVRQLNSGSKEP